MFAILLVATLLLSDSTPILFTDTIDHATGKAETQFLCPDYSVWTVAGRPDDPAVLAWRCPASTLVLRRRAVPHDRKTKD